MEGHVRTHADSRFNEWTNKAALLMALGLAGLFGGRARSS